MTGEGRRIRLAKLLDAYLGPLLIVKLRLLEALTRMVGGGRRAPELEPAMLKKILFIKFWGMGSVILSEPGIRYLKRRYPFASIHYLTLSRNRELFSLLPGVAKVHTLSFEKWPRLFIDSLRLVRDLRREQFDLAFDGEFFVNYSGLMARVVCKRVVGFSRENGYKKSIQDVSVPFCDDQHAVAQFLGLVSENASFRGSFPRPKLTLVGSGSVHARCLHRSVVDLVTLPYLVMNVNASQLAVERRWPGDNFVHIGRILLREYNVAIVLTGSATERSYVDVVERELREDRVHNFCGMLRLEGLARLLRRAAFLISNDSGPVHLGTALNTPVIAFYGPETPRRYGPLSRFNLVFYENLWCSPCMSVENAKTVNCINDLSCMKRIAPEYVIHRVRQFIQRHQLLESRHEAPYTQHIAGGRYV